MAMPLKAHLILLGASGAGGSQLGWKDPNLQQVFWALPRETMGGGLLMRGQLIAFKRGLIGLVLILRARKTEMTKVEPESGQLWD